ncbi:MAG: hypothetical protein LUC39_03230 [Clostridiales bacterium]|nr:hypothetical protein [Clostridiales bacterium]
MPDVNNEAQRFYQNLVDIGFEEEMISRCVLLRERGRRRELLRTLQGGRRDLLNHIHAEQKKLDCLDYLVYRLNQEER